MKFYDLFKQLVIFILLSVIYMGTWNLFVVPQLGVGIENWDIWTWFLPGIITMSILRYMLPGWYNFVRGVDIAWYTFLELLLLGLLGWLGN